MKKNLPYEFIKVLLIFIVTILSSCTELVTDEFPDFESAPTVNSILVAGEPLTVHISLTGGLDSLPLPIIDNAHINLYTDGQFIEQLHYSEKGIYNSNTIIETGKEYKCQIIFPDHDTIVCSQKLPTPTPILKVEHINIGGRDEEGEIYSSVKITFKNNPDLKSYYSLDIKSTLKYDLPDDFPDLEVFGIGNISMKSITDPVFLNEGLPISMFSNEIINDTIYTITVNLRLRFKGNNQRTIYPYQVILQSLTNDYYQYLKQYYLYTRGKSTDIGESITNFPLHSNILNGHGIFAGYSVFVSDTISPEPYEIE